MVNYLLTWLVLAFDAWILIIFHGFRFTFRIYFMYTICPASNIHHINLPRHNIRWGQMFYRTNSCERGPLGPCLIIMSFVYQHSSYPWYSLVSYLWNCCFIVSEKEQWCPNYYHTYGPCETVPLTSKLIRSDL